MLTRPQPGGPSRRRGEGTSTFWIFSLVSAALLLMGWLLPWFVTETSSGVGFSPMDAVSSSPTGIGTILLYLLGLAMLVLLVSPLLELIARLRKQAIPHRADQARAVVAVVGLVTTIVVWLLVRVIQEE